MQITAHGVTDIGQRRKQNEDAFRIDERTKLFVVCDGVGGHAAGDVASRAASEFVVEYFTANEAALRDAHATPRGYFEIVELAEKATIDACRRIHELASSQADCAGMATTMTMLLLVDNKGIMSHVGDSRLYLLRDEELHLLSSDHTLANEMLQRGILTPEEFDASPYQNVLTRSVGSVEAVEAEMLLFDVLPNDRFLLCSDGLTKYIEDDEELKSYLGNDDFSSIPDELVELANLRGGKDNITVVVAEASSDATDRHEIDTTRLKAEALKSTFLCEGISYTRLIRLVEISKVKDVPEGEYVLREGDSCAGLHVVVDGRCAIGGNGEPGRELTAGDDFGDTTLVRKRKARESVRALERATVLVVPRTEFQRLTRRFPKTGRVLHNRLLEHFARRVDDATDTV